LVRTEESISLKNFISRKGAKITQRRNLKNFAESLRFCAFACDLSLFGSGSAELGRIDK
jgi:hypothetical protein